jgi:hypothetical protein
MQSRQLTAFAAQVGIVVCGAFLFAATIQAAEFNFDPSRCFAGKWTALEQTSDVSVGIAEWWGIGIADGASKVLDKSTVHCVSIQRYVAGKRAGKAMCKLVDTDGDTILYDVDLAPTLDQASISAFVMGTGKYKGIQGSATTTVLARGKAVEPNTFQQCERSVGKFTTP